ncbi:hypothetical protein DTO166G4_3134 [Paecilomyces variotii]|nr:hypothetical protein DTO166G4_3134 [Paecilomyces variotii]KAJ9222512.1 hypothetical protein DTO169C6_5103 [Paecilomyces variotii]KAJ9256518.1 hypothetical protein DTO207G8_2521 [Paecilomyces variotii]KAJ9264329.1 hypothetical protein DTO195F2_2489 [Paecilomyces variotii]KAJ9394671.1 hypothetical protein DTO282F9_8397 [Paecilomyces variotii]
MDTDSAAEAGIPHLLSLQAANYRSDFTAPPLAASFKLDEGYSDETRSQAENEANPSSEDVMTLPGWVLAHSEADRAELAYSLLRTLRTSTVAAVVERLTPLLHMDPVLKLPPEITAEIFSYLDPATLLTASLASRAWRARILDSRLWRQLYIREGWGLDVDAIRRFEQQQAESAFAHNRKSRTRHADSDVTEPKLKKRVPPSWLESRGTGSPSGNSNRTWSEQHESVEADAPPSVDDEGDREMQDVAYDRPPSSSTGQYMSSRIAEEISARANVPKSSSSSSSSKRQSNSSLLIRSPSGSVRLNWPHIYKQRRRLEDNWLKGRFTNFQLPDPAHMEDAHQECVYAIQFSGKWLVSGSRDRSVRVWDLDTKRLWHRPLMGHTKSVLCLQFDPSPSEDVIISGSSDKNVIVWRFSTGEKIHEFTAHQDSVLNLRFDHRYLVTCSKDKFIKVWNRSELSATDKDYPTLTKSPSVRFPSYIVDTKNIPSAVLEAEIANRHIKTLAPYSLLMTLEGHGAAVNAIQICGDEIVSASGDRLIKLWDIHNGTCTRTFVGHHKGIACVQSDGLRVVSGSNDDTVRIYDHASSAQVAVLQGHHNLVRTVQAGFGDMPGAEEALRLEAEAVDHSYWEAKRAGTLPDIAPSRRGRLAQRYNPGSRDPKDIIALGAKIPPGGGGGPWGRIVSGSYDETVIIWRRDREGNWVVGQRLRQEDALMNASPFYRGQIARGGLLRVPNIAHHNQQLQAAQAQLMMQNAQVAAPNVATEAAPPPQNVQNQAVGNQGNGPDPRNGGTEGQSALLGIPAYQPTTGQQGNVQVPIPQAQPNAQAAAGNAQAPNEPPVANQLPPHHHHHAHHGLNRPAFHNAAVQPTARVFKLQFDARKIICASQDPRIVGWDFACDDEEIIEASPFFRGV